MFSVPCLRYPAYPGGHHGFRSHLRQLAGAPETPGPHQASGGTYSNPLCTFYATYTPITPV